MSSFFLTFRLFETILSRINIADTNKLAEAVECWKRASGDAPLPDDPSRQKAWDLPIVERNWENMLCVADQVSRAILQDTAQRESGAWLNALPVSSLGKLLDSESFRVAIALRVGADVCSSHSCRCDGRMDSKGLQLHGLSCKYSAGHFPSHLAMNDVVKRALQKACLPSVLDRGVPNSDFCRIRIFCRIHFAESEYSAEHSALPNNEENMFNQADVQCRCSIKQVTLYQ